MKTMYIPKGQALNYDSLEAEHLVVNGVLNVAHGLKARTISGGGLILAGTISADGICVREIEAASVHCLRQRCLPRSAPPCPAISAPIMCRRTG